jgi:hypothetical protein
MRMGDIPNNLINRAASDYKASNNYGYKRDCGNPKKRGQRKVPSPIDESKILPNGSMPAMFGTVRLNAHNLLAEPFLKVVR